MLSEKNGLTPKIAFLSVELCTSESDGSRVASGLAGGG